MGTPRRRGFLLPPAWLLALRVVTGWTAEVAASKAEVTAEAWRAWEQGKYRVQGAAWLLLLREAGLPRTWRPPVALEALLQGMGGQKRDVVQIVRELGRAVPAPEPIHAWRRQQRGVRDVPIEHVVLRR